MADGERLGVEGLHEHAPAARPAPGPARELGDERERALLGAEVGEAQGGVGVEDHAEGHVGEVVPLGHHLGAEQDPRGRRARTRASTAATAPRAAAVSESRRKTGKSLSPSVASSSRSQALGPGAVAGHAERAAARAARRRGLAVAAVVAGEPRPPAVQDERHVALRALPHAPARAAG